jgi:HAD superfamily hydrolase (TIGR01662 family)
VLRGVIFDLGSTLIRYEGDDHESQTHMRADLADYLLAAGVSIQRQAFVATFAAKLDEFFSQRLHDWVEVTAAFVLRETFIALGLSPPPDDLTGRALKAYFSYSEARWQTMPNAHATLAQLAGEGYRLGLISNASDDGNVQRLIDNAGLRRWFDPILVSAAVGVRKPNPRIFEMALEAWGLPAEAVAMVGDTLGADVLGAQLAGLRSVWLTGRVGTPANQAHRETIRPDATIYALSELPAELRSL